LEEVKLSIANKCPDVILFLCKGKEVGGRLDEDLSQLLELTQEIKSLHNYDVPVMGVVTQVDELAPLSNSEPPFEHSAKQENIEATVSILREKINEVITKPIHVIPISAYMEFSEDDTIVYDKRWNIDVLLHYLLLELPEEAQVILAKLSMIVSITMVKGKKLSNKTIVEFVVAIGVNVGVGVALRSISRQLVKVFPVTGSVISGAIASAGTYALSETAIAYFIDHKSTEE